MTDIFNIVLNTFIVSKLKQTKNTVLLDSLYISLWKELGHSLNIVQMFSPVVFSNEWLYRDFSSKLILVFMLCIRSKVVHCQLLFYCSPHERRRELEFSVSFVTNIFLFAPNIHDCFISGIVLYAWLFKIFCLKERNFASIIAIWECFLYASYIRFNLFIINYIVGYVFLNFFFCNCEAQHQARYIGCKLGSWICILSKSNRQFVPLYGTLEWRYM